MQAICPLYSVQVVRTLRTSIAAVPRAITAQVSGRRVSTPQNAHQVVMGSLAIIIPRQPKSQPVPFSSHVYFINNI